MSLTKGLYEQLITREIFSALALLDRNVTRIEQEPLDPVDAYDLLARYVYDVLKRVLRSLPEKERLENQVEICNRILELLAQRLKGAVDSETLARIIHECSH